MAKDFYHYDVRVALEKEGWIVTNDPYYLNVLKTQYEIDLGAELPLAAEQNGIKIAIEIKSFRSLSPANEFHTVLGQYLNYFTFLALQEPERILYLAIPSLIYHSFFLLPSTQYITKQFKLNLIVFNPEQQIIEQWLEAEK